MTRIIIGLVLAAAVALAGAHQVGESPAAYDSGTSTLPYLVYFSDRDGDDDLYAVRADGRRTVQITRDGQDRSYDVDPVLSPDGRWLAFETLAGAFVLTSTDGRRHRKLSSYIEQPVFSPDGRLLAYGEGEDANGDVTAPRVLLAPTAGGRPRPVGHGRPLSFSPNGRFLAFDHWVASPQALKVTTLSSGKTRTLTTGIYSGVGWSPSGAWYAFQRGHALYAIRAPVVTARPRALVRARHLASAQWLDEGRLAYQLCDEDTSSGRLGLVTLDGRTTVLASYRGCVIDEPPQWSRDGRRVAYIHRPRNGQDSLVVETASGTGRQVLLRGEISRMTWSPDGRLVVVRWKGSQTVVALVDLRGRSQAVLRVDASVYLGAWSPDGLFLQLFVDGEADPDLDGIATLSLSERRVVRLPADGNVGTVGWAERGAGLEVARTPAELPPVEIASGTRLRSRGPIAEISASGSWVSAIINASSLDCHHVIGWRQGRPNVVRLDRPRRCLGGVDNAGDEYLVGVELTGTRVSWTGVHFGNASYWRHYRADLRRPREHVRVTGEGSGEHGDEPGRPGPETRDRLGVTMKVEGGAVHLSRANDGRARTIHPPGTIVDAELEVSGLFYAYNSRGPMPGTIVFVPFAELFD